MERNYKIENILLTDEGIVKSASLSVTIFDKKAEVLYSKQLLKRYTKKDEDPGIPIISNLIPELVNLLFPELEDEIIEAERIISEREDKDSGIEVVIGKK